MSAEAKSKNTKASDKLSEINKKRDDLRKKITETKKKERIAFTRLRHLNNKLYQEKRQLDDKKKAVKSTAVTMMQTDKSLADSKIKHQSTAQSAGTRLRDIYEGRQLSFLESLFRADSIQAVLDLSYYQERIVTQDKAIVGTLRAKTAALAARKASLNDRLSKLSSLANAFMERVSTIIHEKSKQAQIASELKKKREYYETAERELAQESKRLESQIPELIKASEKKHKGEITKGTGSMIVPCKYRRVSSRYGNRFHPILRRRRMHTGFDLSAPTGTPVHAADSGNVIQTGWLSGYGKLVIVNHGNNLSTLYGHLSSISVKTGENVKRGEEIGKVGSTGRATGPHLHFEVRVNGKHTDPSRYVSF